MSHFWTLLLGKFDAMPSFLQNTYSSTFSYRSVWLLPWGSGHGLQLPGDLHAGAGEEPALDTGQLTRTLISTETPGGMQICKESVTIRSDQV